MKKTAGANRNLPPSSPVRRLDLPGMNHFTTQDKIASTQMMNGMQFPVLIGEIPQAIPEYPLIGRSGNHLAETGIIPFLRPRFRQQPAFQPGDATFLDHRNIQPGTDRKRCRPHTPDR